MVCTRFEHFILVQSQRFSGQWLSWLLRMFTYANPVTCWASTHNGGFQLWVGLRLLKHDISAQNEGKHILATSIFQNFLGELVGWPLRRHNQRLRRCRSHPFQTNQFESSDLIMIYHDSSDLVSRIPVISLILIRIIPKERTQSQTKGRSNVPSASYHW